MRNIIFNSKNGQIMIIAVIFLTVVMILVTSMFTRTAGFLRFGSKNLGDNQAQNLAEAGTDYALWQLNQTAGTYQGSASTEIAVGETGTFTATVTNKTQTLKTITAVGYIPNMANPKYKRTVIVDSLISGDSISFRYAVQVGTGGVKMENSATVNGTVYSNKPGTNSIQGSGSSKINGDAYAVGTISSPDPTVTGFKYQNQSPSEMPTIDYQKWKDAATAGGTTNCPGGTCSYTSGTTHLGPKKLLGNLALSGSAQVIIDGPLYVTGNANLYNSSSIKLNDSFGSNGTVLIADGTVSTQNSAQFIPTNGIPKGYLLVVSTSTIADDAISVQNSGVNAIFYALQGGANLQNNAQVTALVANSIHIQNSATLNYDIGLASSTFTQGPGASWQIKKGTFKYK